jgi:hypothetical protein
VELKCHQLQSSRPESLLASAVIAEFEPLRGTRFDRDTRYQLCSTLLLLPQPEKAQTDSRVSWLLSWIIPADESRRVHELREEHADYIQQKKAEAHDAMTLLEKPVAAKVAAERERNGESRNEQSTG